MSQPSLCIHRAATEIGGNCIEIRASSGERLLLDAGRPLDTPDDAATPVPATLDVTSTVAGILLSHAHTDHCGLLENLPTAWPVYCGEATEVLLHLSAAMGKKPIRQSCTLWKSARAFAIGPFTVTPYLIDHSAFDAYALRIEVDGKHILYSGDFRFHGRKGKLTEKLMRDLTDQVDVLIMEGTNLPKSGTPDKPTPTEKELERDFIRLFKECKGRVFVSWSAANIDRTVTLYRACIQSGRILVPDIFTTLVQTRLAPFADIPQPEWTGGHMKTVVTRKMLSVLRRLGEDTFVEYLKGFQAAMSAGTLASNPQRWVIMARDSLVGDFGDKGVMPTVEDVWVWSLWKGYLEKDNTQKMRNYFTPCRMEHIHTSGHASFNDLRRFADTVKPKMLVPVHGEAWGEHKETFAHMRTVDNGEWMSI